MQQSNQGEGAGNDRAHDQAVFSYSLAALAAQPISESCSSHDRRDLLIKFPLAHARAAESD